MAEANIVVHEDRAPQLTTHTGLRFREDVLYSDAKGKERNWIRNRADLALERLKDILGRLLEPDEAVLYVANAHVLQSLFAQAFVAGWHSYLRGALLVFTNRRLLVFRTRSQMVGSGKMGSGNPQRSLG